MMFFDLFLWIFAGLFLIGMIFVLEEILSSVFGFILIFMTGIYFAIYFWGQNMLVFSVLFAVLVLFAIRFSIGEAMKSKRNRWKF